MFFCKDCTYFHQHYALDSRKLFRVYCGHCGFERVKKKRPDTKSCEHFVLAPPDEAAFATKEYLSRELVRYMLCLDLLPEIKNME